MGLDVDAGWLWYIPIPGLGVFGVVLSSPDAADAFDRVDCCDASSMRAPSGPVVTTDVTPEAVAGLTLVVAVPAAVVMMPLSWTTSPSLWGALCGAPCGALDMGCIGCELGVEEGGGMLPWGPPGPSWCGCTPWLLGTGDGAPGWAPGGAPVGGPPGPGLGELIGGPIG